jgi:hypothetical protein
MAVRLAVFLPRFVVLALVFLLASATLTFAAQKTLTTPPPAKAPVKAAPVVLVVPEVRHQAYVFAKGILEDHGFGWRVAGSVQGFAANTVVSQDPLPGTQLIDTGAPMIVLRLAQNGKYAQHGTPENASPYQATEIRRPVVAAEPATPVAPATATKTAAPAKAAAPAKPAAKKPAAYPQKRPPAFAVAGAPKEPLDEMPLPDRARLLSTWLETHRKPTNANVSHWLYQHSWIVAGAKLGWWRGAEALRLLIEADRRAQDVWGIGSRSETVAHRALAQVEAGSP